MDWSLIAIAVGSAATVILVILELPRFLRWLRTRRDEDPGQRPASPAPSNLNFNVWHAPAVQVNQVTVPQSTSPVAVEEARAAPIIAKVVDVAPAVPTSEVPALEDSSAKSKSLEETLFDGTITAEAGGHDERHFKLAKGDKVRCFARELGGQDFNLYLMDQGNYASFYKGEGSRDLFTGESESIFKFQRSIPKTGTWYLVVHAPQKRYDREVRLELAVVR